MALTQDGLVAQHKHLVSLFESMQQEQLKVNGELLARIARLEEAIFGPATVEVEEPSKVRPW